MKSSFDAAPDAPTEKHVQYYSMLGTRGIWKDGWKASTIHAPLTGHGRFDEDEWELYHVDVDRSESTNLAAEHPDKLAELIQAFEIEAKENNVYPLDDRPAREQLTIERPQAEPPRNRYIYYPGTTAVPESVAVNVRGRSFKIIGDVVVEDGTEGVIFAHGSRFGGHALFIKDGRLNYVYNFLGIPPEQTFTSDVLTAGPHALGVEFIRESAGAHGESIGTAKLYVDDQVVAEGPMRAQIGKFTLCGDGLCIGFDSADAVSEQYTNPFPFTNGKLLGVGIDVSEEQYLDLELEAQAAFARE